MGKIYDHEAYIQPFSEDLPYWDRGVRRGGLMNKEAMAKNLLDFKEAMDRFAIPFVFIFGTLLGVIREGDFISYDTDVDVACFAPDHRRMGGVIKELRDKGFYIPDRNACPLHDHFFIRDGEKIEVWWFDRIDKEYIYDDIVRYPDYYFASLEDVDFLNTKFKVPNNPKAFLEYTYGIEWTKPNPKASYTLKRHKKL